MSGRHERNDDPPRARAASSATTASAGHVVGVHGKAAFTGWLGLISALDALVRAHADGELSHDLTAMQGGTQ